jgi:hypothetical protein
MGRFVASIPPASPVAPNVALFWQSAIADAGGAVNQTATFDIVANSVEAAGDFRSRVAQGVADTVVERAILEDPPLGINPAYLYAQDLSVGRHWVVLAQGDRDRVDQLGFAPDARARVADDLARGSIVIARDLRGASGPGERAAWWRIDPHNAVTLGMGEDGRGDEFEEEAGMEAVLEQGICLGILAGSAIVLSVAGKEPEAKSLVTYAICVVLGGIGYGAHGTWLAGSAKFADYVLRAFEGLELAHGLGHGGGGHGE